MSTARITPVEIMPLPRWARLALAVRCLRRARALIHPDPAQAAALDTALDRIEQAAATATADGELEESAAAAYRMALDQVDAAAQPDSADRDVVTCMVAHATAFAAEAAGMADARLSAHLVAQSVDFSIHAFRLAGTADAPAALAASRADLERLWAAERNLTDQTPVPASFFTA